LRHAASEARLADKSVADIFIGCHIQYQRCSALDASGGAVHSRRW